MNKSNFNNTFTLLKLAIRRERIRSSLWIAGIGVMILLFTFMFKNLLPTAEDLVTMTIAQSSSPGTRLFLAPASGVSLGGFTMLRVSTTIITIFGLFNFLTVIRHTRQSEDLGQLELIGSTSVGRYSTLTSILLLMIILNILLIIISFASFRGSGLPWEGSLIAALSFGLFGMLFAVTGAITAQLATTSRGASGLAGIIMGVSFLTSGIANALGEFHLDSMTVESLGMTWFSPYGWYQQMHAFHDNRWGLLLLYPVAIVILLPVSFFLLQRRDHGAGMLPARKGRVEASPLLRSPFGLAWRLHRKLMFVWSLVAVIMGGLFGAISEEFSEALAALEQAGALFSEEQMLLNIISVLGSIMVVYVIQGLLIMSGEEKEGGIESVLSTGVSRRTWAVSHILMVVGGVLLILLPMGIVAGIAASGQEIFTIGMLVETTLLLVPAFLVVLGICLFAFSLSHRLFPAVPWGFLIISLGFGPFFGTALDLPDALKNLSPFTHVPYSFDGIDGTGYWVYTVIGIFALGIGVVRLRHRPLDLP